MSPNRRTSFTVTMLDSRNLRRQLPNGRRLSERGALRAALPSRLRSPRRSAGCRFPQTRTKPAGPGHGPGHELARRHPRYLGRQFGRTVYDQGDANPTPTVAIITRNVLSLDGWSGH